jgi:hypothetical protein
MVKLTAISKSWKTMFSDIEDEDCLSFEDDGISAAEISHHFLRYARL